MSKSKGKAIPLLSLTGPEGFRRLRLPALNLLAPKFYCAYPVYKMQKYRTKKK
jgi:hypothetical protein